MKRKRPTAFTLVELLVVIGVVALLIGMLLPALSRARTSAAELRSMSGLRQLLIGYSFYAQENHGAVPFGHTPSTVNGGAVVADDPVSGQTFGYPVSDRYPWRLVPYVSNVWSIIHSHDKPPEAPTGTDTAAGAFSKAYTLSLSPSYGLNSVFVGGDAGFDGFVGDKPNVGRHVVFRTTEAHRPSELIVFTDSRVTNVPTLAGKGYHTVSPPHAAGQQWTVANGKIKAVNTDAIMGIPQGWYSERVVTGFLDGHVTTMLPAALDDMRLWANDADRSDYDYAP